MPCPFANILGEARTGVHSIRLFDFAVVDTVLTIIAAYLTAQAFKINLWLSLAIWFIGGEVLHYVFGVRSAFLEKTGLARNCDIPIDE